MPRSAVVQVVNPSNRSITTQPKTIVGTISPVTAIYENVVRAVAGNYSESAQARIDLAVSLDKSFKESTFNGQQQTQLLDLCIKYRSLFSLS